jgi:hypothetical protein
VAGIYSPAASTTTISEKKNTSNQRQSFFLNIFYPEHTPAISRSPRK